MTLAEALKTGFPIKRASWVSYFDPHKSPLSHFTVEHVLAEDWEVLEKISLSKEDIMNAWKEMARLDQTPISYDDYKAGQTRESSLKNLLAALGFKA